MSGLHGKVRDKYCWRANLPDLDIIAAGVSPVWGKPYRLLAGAGGPAEVARAIMQSLAGSVRRYGGFPATSTMGNIVDNVASGQLAPVVALAAVRAVATQSGGTLRADDAWAALVRAYPPLFETASALANSGAVPESALVALYQRYCDEWARYPLPLPGWSTARAA